MTADRRVRFSEDLVVSTHSYPAIDTEKDFATFFYNVEDYRQFRTERAHEQLEQIKAELRLQTVQLTKPTRPGSSRRDSLTGLSRNKPIPYRRRRQGAEEGVALAA